MRGYQMLSILRTKVVRIVGVILLTIAALVALVSLSESYVKHKVPVSVGGYHVFTDLWDRGYVSFQGTWVMDNSKPAYPLQVSEIVCHLESKDCIESRAEVAGSTLLVNQDRYEIAQWDARNLTYISDADCVDYVYSVDRITKQVSGIRTIKTGMADQCPNTEKELKLRLTDGFDVYWKLQEEARPIAINITVLLLALLWAGFRIVRIVKS